MIGNREIAICETCGREFIKRKEPSKGRSLRSIRGAKMKTCSKKCSMERTRVVNKERNKRKRTKK